MNELTPPNANAYTFSPPLSGAPQHVPSVARESAETGQIAFALVSALSKLRNPPRNRSVEVSTRGGGKYSFRYATLDKILDMARPVLSAEGLVLFQPITTNDKGGLVLVTKLLHRSGEWMETTIPLPAPGADPQSLGSAITYLRRYAVTSLLGIASDEDDDGNRAAGNHMKDTTSRGDRLRDEAERATNPAERLRILARGAKDVEEGTELLRIWSREANGLESSRGRPEFEQLVRHIGVGLRNSLGQMCASAFVRAVRIDNAEALAAFETAWGGEWAHTLMMMQEEAPDTHRALQSLVVSSIRRARRAIDAAAPARIEGPKDDGQKQAPTPNAEGGAAAPNGGDGEGPPSGARFPLIGVDGKTRLVGNARDWVGGIREVSGLFGGEPEGLRAWAGLMKKLVAENAERAPKAAERAREVIDAAVAALPQLG